MGRSTTQFEWEQHEGNWFAKKAQIENYSGKIVSWEIRSIEFTRSAIDEPFTITDKELPFGTRVSTSTQVGDETARPKSHFVGGTAGSLEYRTRLAALTELRKELQAARRKP